MERRPAEPADAQPDDQPDDQSDEAAELAAEARPELRLRTAEDVLARVPFALGFHPWESLVALAIDAQNRTGLILRIDLPSVSSPDRADRGWADRDWADRDPPDLSDGHTELVHHVVAALRQDSAVRTLLVVYSATHPPVSFVDELGQTLATNGVDLVDVLRADGRRWWSLTCPNPSCCPPEGQPYDLAAHPLTVASVYRGEVALPDEEELRASVAPLLGLTRLSMTQATARVEAAIEDRYVRLADPSGLAETFRSDGTNYVLPLLARYLDEPRRPTDDEVAWTSVFVSALLVRDEVWRSMSQHSADRQVRFWREIARRAVPPYDVAPTALLAFAGWLSGNGPLARCALDRVLEANPDYTMAHIVRDALAYMVPPSVWTSWSDAAARIADSEGQDTLAENGEAEGGAAA